MSIEGQGMLRYAQAEKDLSESVSPLLTDRIREIERRHGITIDELRVTMDRQGYATASGWPAANCVIVRAH